MNQAPSLQALPSAKSPEAGSKVESVVRIGNFNILRKLEGASVTEFAAVAAAQSKLEDSPHDQLVNLYKKANALLQAIEKHESSQKKQSLVTAEASAERKGQVQAFVKSLEKFAAEKGVSLHQKLAIKSGADPATLRSSAQSLQKKNKAGINDTPPNPNECFLKTGFTTEQKQLIFKKLGTVLKRLGELDFAIGDRTVFGDTPVAQVINDEISALKILERKHVQTINTKLEFIESDFVRFKNEYKRHFLQQEQRSEMLNQMRDFIKEFGEERIADIPNEVAESVDFVEKNSGLLSKYAQFVEDFGALNQMLKSHSREADENQQILKILKSQVEANIAQIEENKKTKGG